MPGHVAYNRAPCPGRIFEDLGAGFSIGCAGGSIFYFIKGSLFDDIYKYIIGMWNAPRK